jgi:hypothetical protein
MISNHYHRFVHNVQTGPIHERIIIGHKTLALVQTFSQYYKLSRTNWSYINPKLWFAFWYFVYVIVAVIERGF